MSKAGDSPIQESYQYYWHIFDSLTAISHMKQDKHKNSSTPFTHRHLTECGRDSTEI